MKRTRPVFSLIEIGVYAALIFIAISFIRIPLPSALANTFVHPGNALVILSVLLMGFRRGALASMIGLALFDILNGYASVVIFTLIENLLVLVVVGALHHYVFKKKDSLPVIISLGIIGALTKIVLVFLKYMVQQWLLTGNFQQAVSMAVTGMPASIATGIVTAILVPLLYYPMKRILIRFHPMGE